MWCRLLHFCSRYLGRFALVLLVVLATYVAIGRWLLVPMAADYRPQLEAGLSRLTGAEVSIGTLEGRWRDFSPHIYLQDVSFSFTSAEGDREQHVVQSLELGVDVLASLIQRQPVPSAALVRGLDIHLLENAEGQWQVEGFTATSSDPKALVRTLLRLESLEFADTTLRLQRQGGETLQLDQLYAGLRKKLAGGHRLDLMLSLQSQPNPILLAADLQGDPFGEYVADAYLSYRQQELTPVLTWLGDLLPFRLEALRGSAQFWFNKESSGPLRVRSNVGGLALSLIEGNGSSHVLGDIQGLLAGNISNPGRWQLSGEGFSFDHNQRHWQASDFLVGLGPTIEGEARRLNIKFSEISLDLVRDVLLSSRHLPEQAGEVLSALNPSGIVRNLVLDADIADSTLQSLNLQANLHEGAVQSVYGAPELHGVTAYVEMDQAGGRVELDSRDISIYLPRVFDESWRYDEAQGVVSWQLHEDGFSVASGVISASNQFIEGHAQFAVRDYQDHKGERHNELSLLVGSERMDAAIKSRYLPSLSKIRNTMAWLDRAIVSGDVYDSAFIYRGTTLSGGSLAERSNSGFFRVKEGELAFLGDWPALEQVEAYIELQDMDADIVGSSAEIAGMDMSGVEGRIRREDGTSMLYAQGQAEGGTENGLEFLRNSPIRDVTGGFMDDWEGKGQLQMSLDLAVPLTEESRPQVTLEASTDDSDLLLNDYGLTVHDIQGDFHYDSSTGLSADAVKGELFGYPVTVDVSSEAQQGNVLSSRILTRGQTSVAALDQWGKQPEFLDKLLLYTSGEFDYAAELTVYAGGQESPNRLALSSDLVGVATTLPAPFRKTAGEEREFTLNMDFYPERQVLHLLLPELVQAELLTTAGNLQGGLVRLGSHIGPAQSARPEWNPRGLSISGDVAFIDLKAWQFLADEHKEEAGLGAAHGLLESADLRLGTVQFGNAELTNLAARIEPTENGWQVMLENELLGGTVNFPASGRRPWQVDMDYLRLPAGEGTPDTGENTGDLDRFEDALAGVDPSRLPAIRFNASEFTLGDKQLGAWSFLLQPYTAGAYISDLRISIGDAILRGTEGGETGAEIDWRLMDGEHETLFSGRLDAGNLAELLPPLGFDANIESQEATFTGSLDWKGTPAAFRPERLQGTVSLDIQDGRFVDVDSGSSRLFGALNLDTLVRRMQLDFSDLYKKGLAFDEIDGALAFDAGVVRTSDQVRIDSPSSKIRLEGELDLNAQTILADMVVSIPLSQNISVLAGLLGAWPIALSTYLAGRIFEDELADATAITYHLEGPLNDLQTDFEPAAESPEELEDTTNAAEPE